MSAYTPMKGHMFTVTWQPVSRTSVDVFGVATKVVFVDRSYCDEVLECLGVDDHLVVGRRTRCNSPGLDKVVLRRTEVTFHPVGPDVVNALFGVTGDSQDAP